jgi:hypothetical protein
MILTTRLFGPREGQFNSEHRLLKTYKDYFRVVLFVCFANLGNINLSVKIAVSFLHNVYQTKTSCTIDFEHNKLNWKNVLLHNNKELLYYYRISSPLFGDICFSFPIFYSLYSSHPVPILLRSSHQVQVCPFY